MTFRRGFAFVGLVSALALSQGAWAEDKKSTTSTPARAAPVVRAAPAPAPVVRATAPVRTTPTAAPVIRAPATTTAARPASTSVAVKPVATTTVKPATTTTKPATTTSVKPAIAAVKPATTATVKPATTNATKPATTTAATTTPMDRARNRIQSELPADGAVRGDTQKKPDMTGVKTDEFKPKVTYRKPAEVPSPGTPNFPKRAPNDPAPTNPLSR